MYGKLFAQMYDGTLGTRGPWQALVTFQQLIILADKTGTVDMTADALARRTTIPLDIITQGIAELLKPDPDSRTPDEEGRRIVPLAPDRAWGWSIVNYEKYRKMRSEDERREYHRQYWHKRKTRLNTSTATQQTQPIAVSSKQDAVSKKQELQKHAHATLLAFCERLPNLTKDRAFTMGMAQRDPDAWGASMLAILDGMRGAVPTPDEMGEALTEMAATSAAPSPANVRAFLRRAKSDATRETAGTNGRRKSALSTLIAERGGRDVILGD